MNRAPAARRALLLLGLLLALLLGRVPASTALAQAPPTGITVTIALEPEEPRVGDRVHLTIAVEHSTDLLISLIGPPPRQPDLEIIEVQPAASLPVPGAGMRTSFVLVVAPFALGEIEVGGVTLQALREDGSAQEFPVALPLLEVRTTLREGDSDLRPLKPQETIPGAPPSWVRPALLAAALLAVLTGLAAAFFDLRRRRRRGAVALLPPLAAATAEDAARHQLDALRAQDLLGAGDLEAYYGQLSITVRAYLEERFEFRATALTSRELARRMSAEGLDRWQIRLVSGLLERCDAAVYAGRYPPLPSADHDLTLAYEIIEFARPRRETSATEPTAIPA